MSEFVLFESASGYGLLEVVSWEDALADQAADSLPRFSKAIKLKAVHPFSNAMEALENANAISEHALSDTLSTFLEMNLQKKHKDASLGVVDPGLATAISEGTGISCRSDERVREVLRGCRLHWDHFSKSSNHGKAQLGLGHAYSRSKVKFNPARADNMIIQSIALLDTLDKDVNTFAMRVREWYSWHFPELKDLVKDNVQYARVAAFIGDRNTLNADKISALTELVNDDETLAERIISASKHSMGMDCNETDMLNICNFTTRMVQLATYRHKLSLYLHDKMTTVAPNLSALIGDTVAARLISKAGSLTSLAKAPASTVQILGAEKALFRALKTKGNTPKYGLIYHSTFIGRADAKNKGRISRYLANKCSMAVRIDSFADVPTSAYGIQLRNQVEERLQFYETGAAPKRNIDVMEAVAKELKKASDDKIDVDEEDTKKHSAKESKQKEDVEESAKKRKAEDVTPSEEGEKAAKKSAKKAKKEKKKSKKSKKSLD